MSDEIHPDTAALIAAAAAEFPPRTRSDPTVPEVWPECSECHVAYVHRRCLSLSKGWIWAWQQDCKHGRKGTPQPAPILVNADGPVKS